MLSSHFKVAVASALALGAFLAGLWLGIERSQVDPVEREYRPEVRHKDGSVIVERKPGARIRQSFEPPKGYTVERQVRATIQPQSLEPMTLDLALVRSKDDGTRVILKAEGGEVISAVDVPILPSRSTPALKWAAGISYSTDKTIGAWIERDIARLRIGVEATRSREALHGRSNFAAVVRVGGRF